MRTTAEPFSEKEEVMIALPTIQQHYLDGARAALNQVERALPGRRDALLGSICATVRALAPMAPHVLVELLPRIAQIGAPPAAFETFCACRHYLCSYGAQATVLTAILPRLPHNDADLVARALQVVRTFPVTFARPLLLASLACGAPRAEGAALVDEALSRAHAEPNAAEQALALAYTLPYLPDPTRTAVAREADDRLAMWDLAAEQADEVRAFIAPYLAPALATPV